MIESLFIESLFRDLMMSGCALVLAISGTLVGIFLLAVAAWRSGRSKRMGYRNPKEEP